jgi:hypothetical protein
VVPICCGRETDLTSVKVKAPELGEKACVERKIWQLTHLPFADFSPTRAVILWPPHFFGVLRRDL